MLPRQKGKQWEISYRCPGYSKVISERFPTYEEAKRRAAEVEYEKSIGKLRPPSADNFKSAPSKKYITVSEFMDEYVQLYGLDHWGESVLSSSRQRIRDYINPYIGDIPLCDLTPRSLLMFYQNIRTQPAVVLKGHQATGKTVSNSVVHKLHGLLRHALNQAVVWGYISNNPALVVSPPSYKAQALASWTAEEARKALDLCTDPILRLALLLALGCSMRIGEILGLTWSCVDITESSIADGSANVRVIQELKRCNKESLEDLKRQGRSDIYFIFPEWKEKSACTTSLVLKSTKTDSSVRTIYLPKTVSEALREMREQQATQKALVGDAYNDYDMVFAHEDGRPYEERQIASLLRTFIRENDLPPVVFHSFRHQNVK